jgi:hypothetical protein
VKVVLLYQYARGKLKATMNQLFVFEKIIGLPLPLDKTKARKIFRSGILIFELILSCEVSNLLSSASEQIVKQKNQCDEPYAYN